MKHPHQNQDEHLLLHLQQTDETRFIEVLFKTHYARLCKLVFRVVNDRDVAEDIVQDVFMKVWSNRAQLQINTSFSAYLTRAAMNGALNFLEKDRRSVRLEPEEMLNLQPASNTLQEYLDFKEVEEKVRAAIDALPPACKTIFVLSRYEEMTYAEIADSLNLSLKTVENQMGKSLKLLREYLKVYIRHLFSMLL